MAYSLFPDWKEKVVFAEDGLKPQVLEENDRLKVVVAGLEPGQRIPEHPESLGMYHVLEGRGRMVVNGEWFPIAQGATIITPQGASRGMQADTRLVFIAARVT
jgi:quercetin dioxygenase-like cupin family protein